MFGFGSKKIITDEVQINEILTRGVVETINSEHLKKRLLSGKQLTIKLGIDPTSPNLHLGRSVPLLKLFDFQKLGHKVVFIIGDATGVIGDTSDKESERPILTHEQIEENKKQYLNQVKKILDISKVSIRHNAEWLNKLSYNEIGEHADTFSIADFIARDNIKRRLDAGKRVSLREVLYPLMQGYDSVAIKANVEIGGTDQKFNLLAGRTLQKKFRQEPQDIIMTELIEGTDGRKMSSSWGNTINFLDDAFDMYGKVMSIPDTLVEKYFILCTRVQLEGVERLLSESPLDAKKALAREIVKMYHGEEKSRDAEKKFSLTFQEGKNPNDVKEISGVGKPLMETLVLGGVVASNTEFRRLIDAGAITIRETGYKITDEKFIPKTIEVYKIGKRRFIKIV
jgi:tyrosyl-tRNA synthetase